MRRNDEILAETLNKAHNTFPVPAKYRHHLVMPTDLFIKLWDTETIDFEYYNIDTIIYYQERDDTMRLSFTTMKACNEVQIKALEYAIKDKTGSVPILRSGQFKKQIKIQINDENRSE